MDRSILEAPETPAPVFAFRAFKTALFGTPKQPDDEDAKDTAVDETIGHGEEVVVKTDRLEPAKTRPIGSILSPSKPQGILMTPGTTTTQRKSVSFGLAVKDNEGKPSVDAGRSGLPQNYPGKFPSPWTAKSSNVELEKKPTSLTKSLYEARDQSSKKPGSRNEIGKSTLSDDLQRPTSTQTSPTKKRKQEDNSSSKEVIAANADITIDLNEPRSGSGQHWKTRYHRHHERSKEDIRNLLRYKELAKSYAKKKDAEKDELARLLRQERYKVRTMEDEISRLAGEIAGGQRSGSDSKETQSGLVKQLARKTADALEYKRNVDDFEEAMDGVHSRTSPDSLENNLTVQETQRGKTRNTTSGLHHMKVEMDELSRKLEEMTQASKLIEREKAKLSIDLTQAQEDLDRSEKRRRAQEARYRQIETRFEEEKRLLEKRSTKPFDLDPSDGSDKSNQLNAEVKTQEAQLKQHKRRDGHTEGSTDILRLKAQLTELRQTNMQATKDHKLQIERLTAVVPQTSSSKDEETNIQQQQRKLAQELRAAKEANANLRLENEQTNQKLRDACEELQTSREQPGEVGPQKRSTLRSSRQRQPLLNIAKTSLNGTRLDQLPQSGSKSKSFDEQEPLIQHERSISSESFDPILPSPENSFSAAPQGPQASKPRKTLEPSKFNMASSPPQVMIAENPIRRCNSKPRSMERLESRIQQGQIPKSSGQQLTSTRSGLPPDRAAAAKARLKQRVAQKKAASGKMELQKENTRS